MCISQWQKTSKRFSFMQLFKVGVLCLLFKIVVFKERTCCNNRLKFRSSVFSVLVLYPHKHLFPLLAPALQMIRSDKFKTLSFCKPTNRKRALKNILLYLFGQVENTTTFHLNFYKNQIESIRNPAKSFFQPKIFSCF